ncbi:MAG: phage portal protein [Angelakisella sp.]|jgi:HK97 family phage portal protein|nr:phage portal protein [Angelakisella sp.]
MIFDRAISRMMDQAGTRVMTLDKLDGWTTGGVLDTGQTGAMKLSAVNRCVECISDSMAKLPVFVMDGKTKEHLDHPLLQVLERRPNEAMTPSVYKKLMEANRLLHGNAYAAILRDRASAAPVELLPLPPDCVTPKLDQSGRLWYLYTDPDTGRLHRLAQWDVLHYKAYTKDGINGVSVLSRAAEVIQTAKAAQRYEGKFYIQGAQPSGVLTVDTKLEPDAKDKVRQEWQRVHTGVDNAFRVAVLDLGLKYTPISISNRDAQFVESKAVTVEDIARFFGVPLNKLMAGKQAYNSNEQNSIEYVQSTLHPIVSQCEEEDTYKLLFDSELSRGLQVRRNMMAELRGDNASRAAWYKAMREIGYFSVDDICDLEDTPRVPGGDTRTVSLNYVPLEDFKRLSLARNGGREVSEE